jgi:8-oxo-dGTP pyrophosphatase MutT (NUDIX family)
VKTFGAPEPGRIYYDRPAAYVVVPGNGDTVAVAEHRGTLTLPGGGAKPGETPEETVAREVREELAREIRILEALPPAIQYFVTERGRPCRLLAKFFLGAFADESDGPGEHELLWLPREDAERRLRHPCHRWAVEVSRKNL